MPTPTGYFGAIRTAIIGVITEQSEKVQAAYRTDRSKIDGYPAALVSPTQNDADYDQTAPGSNKETYIYTIRLLYPFTEGQENADLALEEALDELIGIFRDRSVLGDAATWVVPVPSVWGYQDRGDGVYRIAEMKISAIKYVES